MESQRRWSHQAVQSLLCLSLEAQSTLKPTSHMFCKPEDLDGRGRRRRVEGQPKRCWGGFWSLLASLIFLSWRLRFNRIWNRIKIKMNHANFTNLSAVCWCVTAWVSTCGNACVCVWSSFTNLRSHTAASLCRRCTQTQCLRVSEWVLEFCSEIGV